MQRIRFSSYFLLLFTILAVPLVSFAQTATTTFDVNTYLAEIQRQMYGAMAEQERNFINPEKIRAKAITDYMDIKTVPQNPGPNEMVQVRIESYLSDLNKANITWSINGNVVDRSIGKTSFSFKNGPAGATTRLTISITTNTGIKVTKELTFTPLEIMVFWEADTYTPPFYKGKPLATAQSIIRAVAIPNTAGSKSTLTADNFVFEWEKDGVTSKDLSGYNKNSFLFEGPDPYGEIRVRVKVSSLDETLKSATTLNVPLSEPTVLLYENRPLLGVWYNRAIDTNITLTEKEISLQAEPYFFSNETRDQAINSYRWILNGKLVENPGRGITFRNDKDMDGRSTVTFNARGIRRSFQNAEQSTVIHFTSNNLQGRQF